MRRIVPLILASATGIAVPHACLAAAVQLELRNPASAPSGLPADMTSVVGTTTCGSDVFMITEDNFDFSANRVTLQVASGEYCTSLVTSFTVRTRGTSQIVTYTATDKPLRIVVSNSASKVQLMAPEESAVSFVANASGPLPGMLWMAVITASPAPSIVAIDLSRSLVISNAKR